MDLIALLDLHLILTLGKRILMDILKQNESLHWLNGSACVVQQYSMNSFLYGKQQIECIYA